MRQLIARACVAVVALVVASIVATPVGARERTATTGTKNSIVNFCTVVTAAELSAAHVSGPCLKGHTVTRSILGVPTVTFSVAWGTPAAKKPPHYLAILVTQASGQVPSAYLQQLRGQVLANGTPLKVGAVTGKTFSVGGDYVSIGGDTHSCLNPGTDDCTDDQLMALGSNYLMTIVLYDVPRPLANEPSSGSDDPNDIAQEQELYRPLAAIEKTATAKL